MGVAFERLSFFWDIWYTNLWLWTWWNPICWAGDGHQLYRHLTHRGFLEMGWMGHFNTFVMVHDDWMRTWWTWWEHDENWTYAHIFGILRWYPLRLLFTISGYMNVYDLYDMTSCRWVILRGYPHDDWETSKWDQPGTVATGTVWATTLEPADPVVSCGEKNRAGWRWCWVRNKTTLNVKGFDGFLFYYAMHFFRHFQTFWLNGFKWTGLWQTSWKCTCVAIVATGALLDFQTYTYTPHDCVNIHVL